MKFNPGLFVWLFSLWFLVQQKNEDVEAADSGEERSVIKFLCCG